MEKETEKELQEIREYFKEFSDEEFIKLYKELMRRFFIEKKRRFKNTENEEIGVEVPNL